MDWNLVARRLILTLAFNRVIARPATRYGMRLGASRFVASEELAPALAVVHELNQQGIAVTLDHLGEAVLDPAAAGATADEYLRALDEIAKAGVDANISLKLTAMGLSIDPQLAAENLRRVVQRAGELGNFVRIDMEDSPYTQVTVDLFKDVFQQLGHAGLVLQAYLYRTEADVTDLTALGANLRLVKGAYKEPPAVAFPSKADVDANFKRLISRRLLSGVYTAVATHDEDAIAFTKALVAEHQIPHDRFEFQMLYGVRSALQVSLAREGYRVRCYVPYGRQWYPYFVRRLAERPANVLFVVRNLFRA